MGMASGLGLMFMLPLDTWFRLVVWLLIVFTICFGYGHRQSELPARRCASRGSEGGHDRRAACIRIAPIELTLPTAPRSPCLARPFGPVRSPTC